MAKRALLKERRKSRIDSSASAWLDVDLETKKALAQIERKIAARKIQRYIRRRTLSLQSPLGSPLGSAMGKGDRGEKREMF